MTFNFRYFLTGLGSLACVFSLHAQTLIVTPSGVGTAVTDVNFRGTLGLFFNVNQSISVQSVGYWDNGTNGIQGGSTISVGIFNVTTSSLVAGTRIDFTGTTGTLSGTAFGGGQFRTETLSSPITLSAGATYAIVAQGYGTNNAYINRNSGNADAATLDTLSGALTLQGSFYDASQNQSLILPGTQAGNASNAQWLAATFTATAIPEPSSAALASGLAVMVGAITLRRRRS